MNNTKSPLNMGQILGLINSALMLVSIILFIAAPLFINQSTIAEETYNLFDLFELYDKNRIPFLSFFLYIHSLLLLLGFPLGIDVFGLSFYPQAKKNAKIFKVIGIVLIICGFVGVLLSIFTVPSFLKELNKLNGSNNYWKFSLDWGSVGYYITCFINILIGIFYLAYQQNLYPKNKEAENAQTKNANKDDDDIIL